MKSVMQHNFGNTPSSSIPRSSFNLSHGLKTTFDSGFLIPVLCREVLPSESMNLKMHALARLSTPLHPFMDNVFLDSFFFSIPVRLLWENWQRFNGEQDNPTDSTDYIIPTMTAPLGGHLNGSVSDYFGLPTEVDGVVHSALFHRAMNKCWNDWFRDENLQDSAPLPLGDGPDLDTDYPLLKRGKRRDYYTSALPFLQKGPSVPLPLGTSAPLISDATNPTAHTTADATVRDIFGVSAAGGGVVLSPDPTGSGNLVWDNAGLIADLTAATAATVNQLRQAFQIQKLFERDARGGTRYIELLKSHFGVTSPDARLQRSEYLGGGSSALSVSPVAQTSNTSSDVQQSDTPQGNLAAIGTVSLNNHGFTKSFTEHCIVLGFVSARADLTYQNHLERMWSRSTRWDFFWPALQGLGEQAILQKEIFSSGIPAEDDLVFGYIPRFDEYRHAQSKITGQFRSNYATSLDTWHLSQDFLTAPLLNASFIEENPPIERVIAVQTEPQFIFDSYFQITSALPMPTYGIPGMIDHF